MTNVYIVCGAGASSTFLAVKLRSLSQNLGHNLQFFPAALETVQPNAADLVVVASHIASARKVQELAEGGANVIHLSEHANVGFKADEAMSLILQALKEQQ
jgi:PTS system cellobiose-specific IIB component